MTLKEELKKASNLIFEWDLRELVKVNNNTKEQGIRVIPLSALKKICTENRFRATETYYQLIEAIQEIEKEGD